MIVPQGWALLRATHATVSCRSGKTPPIEAATAACNDCWYLSSSIVLDVLSFYLQVSNRISGRLSIWPLRLLVPQTGFAGAFLLHTGLAQAFLFHKMTVKTVVQRTEIPFHFYDSLEELNEEEFKQRDEQSDEEINEDD